MSGASTPLVVAVSGVKNSGKTTLIEGMLPLLTAAGLRVAVVKHDGHTFQADVPGTDSFRCRAAGAVGTAVFDGEKSLVVRQGRVTESHLIAQFSDADLVLLEGFKSSFWPKVELVRRGVSDAPVCDPSTLLALVTDQPLSLPGVPTLPMEPEHAAGAILGYWREKTGTAPAPAVPQRGDEPAPGRRRAAVLTVGDGIYAGTEEDAAGPEAVRALAGAGFQVVHAARLPNDRAMLGAELARLCDEDLADLVLTVGGSGCALWDCAPEAVLDAAERALPGIPEALRWNAMRHDPLAALDRGAAGIRRRTLLVNLPGELPALRLHLPLLLPLLERAIERLR